MTTGVMLERAAPEMPAPIEPAETASTAVAVQARAAVEARYKMALMRPRNWDEVRVRLLAACKRPGFAETARYAKPVGGKSIEGPSIRFAEEALRAMGNAYVETMVIFDDDERRIVRVTVTDLEANLSYPHDITLRKTVERRRLKDGQRSLGERVNSYGDTVYLVEATEDDLLTKQAAHVSKVIRTAALRLLPSDILEEAMEQVLDTVRNRDAKDPDAARKKVCDAFYAIGVSPSDLMTYLGHPLEQTSPAELQLLRTIYTAIKEGEATWPDTMAQREDATGRRTSDAPKAGAAGLKDRLGQKASGKGAAQPAADGAPTA